MEWTTSQVKDANWRKALTCTVVVAQFKDTFSILESLFLLVIRLDALGESRRESEEIVCKV